jgi:hydroxymethylpyrimidine/phosphomethylpyrimidine kinase
MIANKIGQQVAQGLKNTKYQFVLDTVMANGGSGTLFIK